MSISSEIDRINANVANTYSALEGAGADMPAQQNTDNLPETVLTIKAVRYDAQTLTDAQKAQARANIEAVKIVQQTTQPTDTSVLWIDPSDNTSDVIIKEESKYQYIFKNNITDGCFWWFDEGVTSPYKYKYNNYSVAEPITLKAGTYHFSPLMTPYTWFKVGNNNIQPFDYYYPEIDGLTSFTLNITEITTVWLTYHTPAQISNTTPYVVSGDEALRAGEYFEGEYSLSLEKILNYNIFELAYIKNGELVVNNRNVSVGRQGDYTGVKMGSNIKKLMCKARFVPNATVALVTTNFGSSLISDITRGSIHLVFSINHCSVGFYKTVDKLTEVRGISYTIQEGAEVSFGFEVDESANTLTVYLPNGTTQTITDDTVSTLNGKYAIWEHYINTENVDFAFCRITKLWCKDTNGEILNDNLKRFDGAIGVAPTGQTYRQFATNDNEFS